MPFPDKYLCYTNNEKYDEDNINVGDDDNTSHTYNNNYNNRRYEELKKQMTQKKIKVMQIIRLMSSCSLYDI